MVKRFKTVIESHTAAQLYSKEKTHGNMAQASKRDADFTRYLGREGSVNMAPSRFNSASRLERKANQHSKAKDAARRLMASLKVSGKTNTKELSEISSKTAKDYLHSSILSATSNARKSGMASAHGEFDKSDHHERKARNRIIGQIRALRKLKEEKK